MRSQKLFGLFVSLSFGAILFAQADGGKNLAATLFTESDATDVMPAEVQAAASNTAADGQSAGSLTSQCSYVSTKKNRQIAHVDLMVKQWKNAELARAQFESMKIIYRGADVSGVGDAAFRSINPAQLHVLKGRTFVTVTAVKVQADKAMEEAVAATALRRLTD
jgi:hypothetical protein